MSGSAPERRVLVTGGAGFVGSALVRRLLEDGARVVALDNFLSGRPENLSGLGAGLSVVEGDVLDEEVLASVFADFRPQQVYHLVGDTFVPTAYRLPQRFVRINVEGTLAVLLAAVKSGIERLLYVSSTEVYGRIERQPISEDQCLDPVNTYAVTKQAADRLCYTFFHEHELPVIIARIFNCYGPRETQPYVVPEVIRQLQRGPEVRLGNVAAARDLTYVDDTARALCAVMGSGLPDGEPVNVGSGRSVELAELVGVCARLMGRPDYRIRSDPKRLRRLDIDDFRCDASRLRGAVGWEPEVSLEEGLRRTIDWFRANGSRWSWEDWCEDGVV